MQDNLPYKPDPHTFTHSAVSPWPTPPHHQVDWVDTIATLESWLEQYIGKRYIDWAYSVKPGQKPWQVCIAFRLARSESLYLLQWA